MAVIANNRNVIWRAAVGIHGVHGSVYYHRRRNRLFDAGNGVCQSGEQVYKRHHNQHAAAKTAYLPDRRPMSE